MKHFDDIQDDEIRIIGRQEVIRKPLFKRWWFWTVVAAICLLTVLILFFILRNIEKQLTDAQKNTASTNVAVAPTIVTAEPAYVIMRDTVINDVPLRLLTPVNAIPELLIGMPDTMDQSLILCFQAADIRADNHDIVGAFILKGELLSRGVAKKGFCSIIGGKIQLGMAESTPLFEEAIDKEGYFFRQYPLVYNGQMVDNKPKNKALRHALCELNGRIVTVSSLDKESFHDFAQAVADLGVQNAIALTGGASYGFLRNGKHLSASDSLTSLESWSNPQYFEKYKNLNFIVWKSSVQ